MTIDPEPPIRVSASYSTLSAGDLLTRVLPGYAIETPTGCQFWEQGVNDTYSVECGEQRYSLRVYRHGLRSREAVEFELAAVAHLHQAGASVAFAIEKTSGGYITEVDAPEGRRYVILTHHAQGREMSFGDTDDARLFGASVATIHHLSDDFETPFQRRRLDLDQLLDASLRDIRPWFKERVEDLELIDDTAKALRERVLAVPISALDIGFCHGDFHGGNVHRRGTVLKHFDFEICGFGYRAFDLATFKWSTFLNSNEKNCWQPFLEGYRSVRDLADADFELINALVPIRHLWVMALNIRAADDLEHSITSSQGLDYQMKEFRKVLDKVQKPDEF